jgi:hypothetical protein
MVCSCLSEQDSETPLSLATKLENHSVLLEIQSHEKAVEIRTLHARRQEYLDSKKPPELRFDDDNDVIDMKSPSADKRDDNSDDENVAYAHISLAHSHSASHSLKLQQDKELIGGYASAGSAANQFQQARDPDRDSKFAVELSKRRTMSTVQFEEEQVMKRNYKRSISADTRQMDKLAFSKDDIHARFEMQRAKSVNSASQKTSSSNQSTKYLASSHPLVASHAPADVENIAEHSLLRRANDSELRFSLEESANNVVVVDQGQLMDVFRKDRSDDTSYSRRVQLRNKKKLATATKQDCGPGIVKIEDDMHQSPSGIALQSGCSGAVKTLLLMEDFDHLSTPGSRASCSSWISSTTLNGATRWLGAEEFSPTSSDPAPPSPVSSPSRARNREKGKGLLSQIEIDESQRVKVKYHSSKYKSNSRIFVPDFGSYDEETYGGSKDMKSSSCLVM